MEKFHGKKSISCTTCNSKFPTASQLDQHIQKTHTNDNAFTCKVCNRTCSSASYLKKHLLAHINAPIDSSTNIPATNPLPASSSTFNLPISLSNHPSTFYAINEMSAALSVDSKMPTSSVNAVDEQTSNNVKDIDKAVGKDIYQAIDPSIFRIQQVRSVGHPIVKTDRDFDQPLSVTKSQDS